MIWKKKNAAMQGNDPSAAAANDKTAGKLAGAKAFARKNWKWLVPAAVVVLAGGVFLLKPANDKQANVDTSYVETAPEERDVSNSLSGTGTLTACGNVKNGIKGASDAVITVDEMTLNIDAADDGLSCDDELTIKGGRVNITAGGDAVKASPDTDDTENPDTT